MGCENSKTVRVEPVGPAAKSALEVAGKEGSTQTLEAKHKLRSSAKDSTSESAEYTLDKDGNKVRSDTGKNKSNEDSTSSSDTLSATAIKSPRDDRGSSAVSKKSTDSGLGEENSEDSEAQKTEKLFRPRDELGPRGVKGGNNTNDNKRRKEADIMKSLHEEGLISRPKIQSSGGMCFEILDAAVLGSTGLEGAPKRPPRLEKLALERGKKKKRALTEDEIREKLERAERRRKKREQERLHKIREMERTDAVAALENFVQYQKSKEETISQRLDQALDNRERKQRELKEKQERRKKHAEEVRKRKALAADNGTKETTTSLEDDSLALKMTPRPEMAIRLDVLGQNSPKDADSERRSSSRNSSRSIERNQS